MWQKHLILAGVKTNEQRQVLVQLDFLVSALAEARAEDVLRFQLVVGHLHVAIDM